MNKLFIQKFMAGFFLLTSCSLWAEEYVPPSSPPLYHKEELKVPTGPVESHAFYSLGLSFGQSRVLRRASPVAAYLVRAEVGYVKTLSLWSRFEPSLEIFTGKIGSSDADMTVPLGALLKLGYGYSLGSKMMGVWRLGVGMAMSNYDFDDDSGVSFKSKKDELGTAIHAGFDLVMPIDAKELVWGLAVTQFSFNFDKVKASTGETVQINEDVTLNTLDMHIGVRF